MATTEELEQILEELERILEELKSIHEDIAVRNTKEIKKISEAELIISS